MPGMTKPMVLHI